MKTLTITEIAKKPALLKQYLKKGDVRIVWKEQKPGGQVTFSAIVKKEGKTK